MYTKRQSIPSSKGELAAAISFPSTETGKLAVLRPGYLGSKDYAHLVSLADELAKQGYVSVRFDPTGTWESQGTIEDYKTTQCLVDIKNVIDYMLKQGNFRHILLGGHSRGGQISLLYAASDSRITVVLGIMPTSIAATGDRLAEWEKIGTITSCRHLPNDPAKQREFKVPISCLRDHQSYDVLEGARKIKAHVILIGGELDKLSAPHETMEIFKHVSAPKELLVIPKIGHDYASSKREIRAVNEGILGLLRKAGAL